MNEKLIRVRRALIAVSDKTGLIELAATLIRAGVEIVSTGGTAATISKAGYPVTQVQELTGFPEHLHGRVRTLHPHVHSGILADMRKEEHQKELAKLGIEPFQLVVVNLYPFAETAQQGMAEEKIIEQIDIGGAALLRAAAKNYANVMVTVSPLQYSELAEAIMMGGTNLDWRRTAAVKAFQHVAEYDMNIANWFSSTSETYFPGWLGQKWERTEVLRYGENPHQSAALYQETKASGLAKARQLQGKALSYNNYTDADAAVRAVYDHASPTVAIIKHANPCGVATAAILVQAHKLANECDPISAYGGVVAANRTIDRDTAVSISGGFVELVVAPGFAPEALEVFSTKTKLRLLQLPENYRPDRLQFRHISGGLLYQSADVSFAPATEWELLSGEAADKDTLADLAFAHRAVKSVKSNAILLADNQATVGIGMGQVNRVDSCRLAVERAGDRALGAVAASDAFFPFPDGPRILAEAGVRAIVQPGGSIRDQEVIAVCAEYGLTLYHTGERHFLH